MDDEDGIGVGARLDFCEELSSPTEVPWRGRLLVLLGDRDM